MAAALILTVPLTTTAGAGILAWSAREEAAAFAEAAKARGLSRRRLDAVVAARAELERALARPMLGQSMAMLASELPRGTTIQRVARENDGAFTVVVVAGDPDGLRAALERSPALSTLSEVAQDGSETGGLRVTLRSFEL